MDKICIVKRRKRMGELAYQEAIDVEARHVDQPQPDGVSCVFVNGASGVRIQDPLPSPAPGNIDQKLTVQVNPLCPQPIDRDNSIPLADICRPDAMCGDKEGKYVFNFLFKKVHDVRMLSSRDVCTMLKVSRHFLANLVKTGQIDSYKLGRLRRFLLDDILTYLGENREIPAIASSSKMRRPDQRD